MISGASPELTISPTGNNLAMKNGLNIIGIDNMPKVIFASSDLITSNGFLSYNTSTQQFDFSNDVIIDTGAGHTNDLVCYLSTGQLGHCAAGLTCSCLAN